MAGIGVIEIARICHNANQAFCKSIGDNSQDLWEDASEDQKGAAIAGVKFHLKGKHSPEESHESWLKKKKEDGWVFGEVKDEKKKTHPSLVPYKELSTEEKSKDFIFQSIVESFKAIMGPTAW